MPVGPSSRYDRTDPPRAIALFGHSAVARPHSSRIIRAEQLPRRGRTHLHQHHPHSIRRCRRLAPRHAPPKPRELALHPHFYPLLHDRPPAFPPSLAFPAPSTPCRRRSSATRPRPSATRGPLCRRARLFPPPAACRPAVHRPVSGAVARNAASARRCRAAPSSVRRALLFFYLSLSLSLSALQHHRRWP